MTQNRETYVPAGAVAANSPDNWDIWHNPTDEDFIVAAHSGSHQSGATKYYRLRAHTDTPIEREYRRTVQTYLCNDPSCRAQPGSKICLKDHPAIVSGGQAPMAIRKGAPHIRPNATFSPDFVENSIPANGAIPGKSGGDNSKELQPKLEAEWKRITVLPPDIDWAGTGPQPKRAAAKAAPVTTPKE